MTRITWSVVPTLKAQRLVVLPSNTVVPPTGSTKRTNSTVGEVEDRWEREMDRGRRGKEVGGKENKGREGRWSGGVGRGGKGEGKVG